MYFSHMGIPTCCFGKNIYGPNRPLQRPQLQPLIHFALMLVHHEPQERPDYYYYYYDYYYYKTA